MQPQIVIRKIEKFDFEFIYTSICDLQNETFDKLEFEKIFYKNISNSDFYYLVAQINTDKVGLITFHTQKLLHHCGLVGEIQEFYILPEYRGKGIGKRLIEEIFNHAELKNIKSIEVTTNKKRIENINIYENLGFILSHNKFTIYK